MSKPKAIIVSGYFNPLHKGHLELFESPQMVFVGLRRVLGETLGGALEVCDGSGVSRVGPLEAFG